MSLQYQSEAEFLKAYNIHDYEIPLLSVDLVIFTLHQQQLKVLLIKRGDYPAKGEWALPGGFIDVRRDKNLRDAALRKLKEKTQVAAPYLEQLESVGSPSRDPRGWSVTVVYFAMIPFHALQTSGDSTGEVSWVPVDEAEELTLAFDHSELLKDALSRVRSKVLYTLIPAYLIESPFTLTSLQRAYEVIIGRDVEKKAFRRRLENADVLEPTGTVGGQSAGRPAAFYQLKSSVDGFSFTRQLNP